MTDQKRQPVIHIHPPPAAIEALKRVNGTRWREAGEHLIETHLLKWSDPSTIIVRFSNPALKDVSAEEQKQVADAMTQAASKKTHQILSARLLERVKEIAAADPDVLRLALRETDGRGELGGEPPPEAGIESREASGAEIIEATRAAHPLAADAVAGYGTKR